MCWATAIALAFKWLGNRFHCSRRHVYALASVFITFRAVLVLFYWKSMIYGIGWLSMTLGEKINKSRFVFRGRCIVSPPLSCGSHYIELLCAFCFVCSQSKPQNDSFPQFGNRSLRFWGFDSRLGRQYKTQHGLPVLQKRLFTSLSASALVSLTSRHDCDGHCLCSPLRNFSILSDGRLVPRRFH